MPCHVCLVDTTACATACIDARVDSSIVLGSVHAHVHFGPYASTADSTDACSHDGIAVSLDDSGGHKFNTSNLSTDTLRLYGHSLGGAFRPAEAWGYLAMPCHGRLVDIIGCATVCIDVSIDPSDVLGSIHASTDASSDDGTTVGLDASGGHTVDTIIPTSLAPPRGRRRRRRPRRP